MVNDNIVINKMKREIELLKTQLERERLLREKEKNKMSISKEHVDIFAKKILDKANLSFVPDSMEQKLYSNLLMMGMEVLKEALDTIKLDFLGHHITLKIERDD